MGRIDISMVKQVINLNFVICRICQMLPILLLKTGEDNQSRGSYTWKRSMRRRRRKHRKEKPMAKLTAGGKNIARKHPDATEKEKSPVSMVITPIENGSYHYPLALPT